MHNAIADKRRNFADRRQPMPASLPAAFCTSPVPASACAVHGSQIKNYMFSGPLDKAMSAVITAYTLLSPSSAVVTARVYRRARLLRSTPYFLIVAGA